MGLTDPFISGRPLNGMKFTTRDQDNDLWSVNNCGQFGGWWYNSCSHIQLNREYENLFILLNGQLLSPTFVEMKIRPQNCGTN